MPVMSQADTSVNTLIKTCGTVRKFNAKGPELVHNPCRDKRRKGLDS